MLVNMSNVLSQRLDQNIQRLTMAHDSLEGAQDAFSTDTVLPSPRSEAEAIDGMNAFRFKNADGSNEGSNISDRLRQLDRVEAPTLLQRQEKAALEVMGCASSTMTLFGDGWSSSLGGPGGPKHVRDEVLAKQGFAIHAPDIDMGMVVTGMARREAEREPSEQAWMKVNIAALKLNVDIQKAQASAEEAKQSEGSVTKAIRGLKPYLRQMILS